MLNCSLKPYKKNYYNTLQRFQKRKVVHKMLNKLKQVTMHIATICERNPGTGCFGTIMTYKSITKEITGIEPETTKKRIELTAVIKSLQKLKEPCNIKIYSPSTYVCYAVNNKWLANWEKNNWKRSQGRELKNADLWETLNELLKIHNVTFICTQKQNKKSNSYKLADNAYKAA